MVWVEELKACAGTADEIDVLIKSPYISRDLGLSIHPDQVFRFLRRGKRVLPSKILEMPQTSKVAFLTSFTGLRPCLRRLFVLWVYQQFNIKLSATACYCGSCYKNQPVRSNMSLNFYEAQRQKANLIDVVNFYDNLNGLNVVRVKNMIRVGRCRAGRATGSSFEILSGLLPLFMEQTREFAISRNKTVPIFVLIDDSYANVNWNNWSRDFGSMSVLHFTTSAWHHLEADHRLSQFLRAYKAFRDNGLEDRVFLRVITKGPENRRQQRNLTGNSINKWRAVEFPDQEQFLIRLRQSLSAEEIDLDVVSLETRFHFGGVAGGKLLRGDSCCDEWWNVFGRWQAGKCLACLTACKTDNLRREI